MEIDLHSVEENGTSKLEHTIIKALSESLASTSTQDAKITNLANRINRLCPSTGSEDEITTWLWNFWLVVLTAVKLIPPDHPW